MVDVKGVFVKKNEKKRGVYLTDFKYKKAPISGGRG
jgi:hypothetical protein